MCLLTYFFFLSIFLFLFLIVFFDKNFVFFFVALVYFHFNIDNTHTHIIIITNYCFVFSSLLLFFVLMIFFFWGLISVLQKVFEAKQRIATLSRSHECLKRCSTRIVTGSWRSETFERSGCNRSMLAHVSTALVIRGWCSAWKRPAFSWIGVRWPNWRSSSQTVLLLQSKLPKWNWKKNG